MNDYLRLYPEREAQMRETLNYFDGINFAPLISAPMMVYIGLHDDVCPPETGYALFNRIAASSSTSIDWYGHETGVVHAPRGRPRFLPAAREIGRHG